MWSPNHWTSRKFLLEPFDSSFVGKFFIIKWNPYFDFDFDCPFWWALCHTVRSRKVQIRPKYTIPPLSSPSQHCTCTFWELLFLFHYLTRNKNLPYKWGHAFEPRQLNVTWCSGCSSPPDVYVCLVLQEEEGALAVLPLHGHVQQGLPIRHGVIDASPRAQQLCCNRVHACKRDKPQLMPAQLLPLPQPLTTTNTPSRLRKASSFPHYYKLNPNWKASLHKWLAPLPPPSLAHPSSGTCLSAATDTALPVHNARPSTVWSRESLRLKSGMICKLLVAWRALAKFF